MARPPHVLLACSGLEHARRGYETFARECFDALVRERHIELELAKGSGRPGEREHVVRPLRRDRALARQLARALGARPFRLEALTFAASLQPLLARRHPELVYVSEWDTARALVALRRITRQRFKLLLCNGGFASSGFGHLDHVQELTPAARDYVVELGADPERHTVLPLGFSIGPELALPSPAERESLRRRLALPQDRMVLISVAALNRSHKRLDYLIEELARLPAPRPFALLVGEPDAETPELRSLASRMLGNEGHRFLTVAPREVPELLCASDAFVLTSVSEMQGRAAIEAMAAGLPCIVHDSPVMRFAVGSAGVAVDLTRAGALAGALSAAAGEHPDSDRARERHRHVYERFSWDRLRPRYVRLLTAVARGEAANSTVSSSTGEAVWT